MTMLNIIKHPHTGLRQICKPVLEVDGSIRKLVSDMRETMLASEGIGLAASQVGIYLRVLVIDISENKNQLITLINPEIMSQSGEISWEEGCLSIPGIKGAVNRSRYVHVSGWNINQKKITFDAEDLLAVCLQHEIDHLNGVLFIDHLSPFKRQRLLKKYEKFKETE